MWYWEDSFLFQEQIILSIMLVGSWLLDSAPASPHIMASLFWLWNMYKRLECWQRKKKPWLWKRSSSYQNEQRETILKKKMRLVWNYERPQLHSTNPEKPVEQFRWNWRMVPWDPPAPGAVPSGDGGKYDSKWPGPRWAFEGQSLLGSVRRVGSFYVPLNYLVSSGIDLTEYRLTHGFIVTIVSPSHPWVLYLQVQQTSDQKYWGKKLRKFQNAKLAYAGH